MSYEVVRDKATFLKKKNCPGNGGNGSKIGFFEFTDYEIWFLRSGPKCFWPVRLKNF